MKTKTLTLLLLLSALPGFLGSALAAGADTAKISGRVFSPATGEYLRNAEISLQPSGQTTTSGSRGEFSFPSVPAGAATLTVRYTGYRTATMPLQVAPGETITREVALTSSLDVADASTVQLERFVVSSEREGNAKAIMDQRQSMNITHTVASDVFGDNAEGNVGEFVKNLPGVQLFTDVNGEIRNIRLRGLASEYTAVTLDGVSLASTDANSSTLGDARAFSFEQISLSSMDSIEVMKTISADVDANAPAGTVNLRTKRAFDREGRRVSIQANVTAHSEEFHLKRTLGPDDTPGRKARAGGIFEYSDVFLNRRLGLVLNISESNQYNEVSRTTATFNRTTTATDRRPVVVTAIGLTNNPRFNRRFATTFTADYKATPQLVLSLAVIANQSELWNGQRSLTFNFGTRAQITGDDPSVNLTSGVGTGSVVSNPANVAKMGHGFSVLPKFEYKAGAWTLEGIFAGSNSSSWYDPLGRHASIRDTNGQTATGVTLRAERSSPLSPDWKITQTAGPDISSGANFTSPTISLNDGRFSRAEIYSGELVASTRTQRILPVTWKAGLKRKIDQRKFNNDSLAFRYDYIGPGAGARGAWTQYRSPYEFSMGQLGGRITSISGGETYAPNLLAIGALYYERPQDFRQNLPVANYYASYVTNKRRYEETIDASYLMGTSRWGKVDLRAGLRWEETNTDATEPGVHTPAEVRAAGFPVAAGQATTIPGIQYQYLSLPRVHRQGEYDNWFPSASAKFNFTSQLSLHFGYSSTIRRPTFRDVAGVWVINDETFRVNAPNPNLKPETSDNYSARLAYYFEPVGLVAVSFFQNQVKGLHAQNELTAQEFGYNGQENLSNYTFVTVDNSPNTIQVRGMEIEYSQSLSFLPGVLRGTTLRASYTRNYAEIVTINMAPHSVSAGLTFGLSRFSAYVNGIWNDNTPSSATGAVYLRHRTTVDAGCSFRLTRRFSLFASGRNVTDAPISNMNINAGLPDIWSRHEIYGSNWTFGVKGVF